MKSKDPRVSIIISNYNGRTNLGELLDRCLKSILDTDYPNYELIFVDDGSQDDSFDYVLRKYGSGISKLIKLPRNSGPALARNIAAGFAEAEYLAFLDNDVVVPRNWLKSAIKCFEDPKVGAVFPKLMKLDFPEQPESLGGIMHVLGYPIELLDLGYEPRSHRYRVFSGKLAAMVIRAQLFRRLGGFDSKLRFYFEESDLCWRLWLEGFKAIMVSESSVYHLGGGTFRDRSSLARVLLLRQRNTLASLIKNSELGFLIKWLPLRILMELGGMGYLAIKRQPELMLANLMAILHVIRWLGNLIRERARIKRKITTEELRSQGILISSLANLILGMMRRFEEFRFRLALADR